MLKRSADGPLKSSTLSVGDTLVLYRIPCVKTRTKNPVAEIRREAFNGRMKECLTFIKQLEEKSRRSDLLLNLLACSRENQSQVCSECLLGGDKLWVKIYVMLRSAHSEAQVESFSG